MPFKVLSILGARPQFVKAAAVSREFASRDEIDEVLVHTGQHFDENMSQIFFDELGIPQPAYNLHVNSGGHGTMTGRMLEKIEEVIVAERPDCVLVYGDTNSTLAGALAAAKLHVPVAHVEAGLRSFNRRMPEEINRVLTDHVSTMLFCPTKTAVENLANEGISQNVNHTGDVMYDASIYAAALAEANSEVLIRHGLKRGQFALASVHRAENTDSREALIRVISFLNEQAREQPVALPLHPRTRAAIDKHGLDTGEIVLLPPVGFLEMAALLTHSTQIFTDSGGVQKEAYFYGKPCVTLRDETEWVETVENGWNRLWHGPDYGERRLIEEYGDGNASGKIADLLIEKLASRR